MLVRSLCRNACILCGSIIFGIVLLAIVYMLPQETMKKHVSASMKVLQEEGPYPLLYGSSDIRMTPYNYRDGRVFFFNNRGTARDNITDSTMLQIAIYDSNYNLLERVMRNSRSQYEESNEVEILGRYLDGEIGFTETDYARYWHGYLVLLKPLLLFFTYTQIRLINVLAMSALLLMLLILLWRRGQQQDCILLFYSILFMFPAVIPFCMQYCTTSYIVLAALLYFVIKNSSLENRGGKAFLIIGIATSYFDFLTFPLLSCGLPLTYLLNQSKKMSLTNKMKKIVNCGLHWGIGYIVMWAAKWATATMILGENIIEEAIMQVAFRASDTSELGDFVISPFRALASNLSCYTNIYFLFLMAIGIMWIVTALFAKRFERLHAERLIPYLTIAILPFIWVFMFKNHSYGHGSFTYRIFSLTIYSGMSMFLHDKRIKD